MSTFQNIRAYSDHSIDYGYQTLSEIAQACVSLGYPVMPITEKNTLSSFVKASDIASKNGLDLLLGVHLDLEQEGVSQGYVLLYPSSTMGFSEMIRVVNFRNQQGALSYSDLLKMEPQHCKVVIGSNFTSLDRSARLGNPIFFASDFRAACDVFGKENVFLEISKQAGPSDDLYLAGIKKVIPFLKAKSVVTAPSIFSKKTDYEAAVLKARISSKASLTDFQKSLIRNLYLKPGLEVEQEYAGFPDAIASTLEIAASCAHEPTRAQVFYPTLIGVAPHLQNAALRDLASKGLEKRMSGISQKQGVLGSVYTARLERELEIIANKGFSGYFLVVQDFVSWAKNNEILVGPGRGSGAGSLTAYALGITEVDPVKYNLLFERFLNPERSGLPDFDIDLPEKKRHLVTDYVIEKYGRDFVCQIATSNQFGPRQALIEAAKVMATEDSGRLSRGAGHLLDVVRATYGANTLPQARDSNPELLKLLESNDECRSIFEAALALEGRIKNTGTHPCGFVISPVSIKDKLPQKTTNEALICELDKSDIESLGFVKFDFLGSRVLNVIESCLASIKKAEKDVSSPFQQIDYTSSDPKVFSIFEQGALLGVFQCDTPGAMSMAKLLKPKCLDDLIALIALNRPGPKNSGMDTAYIERCHQFRESQADNPLWYPIPESRDVLRSTYGVIVYQEQVMELARSLAGYTLGEADGLRSAISKKNIEEIRSHRVRFVDGASVKGIDTDAAGQLFDDMEKFGEYGFNLSHSAVYAHMSYQTAWLKVNYPAHFYAALLDNDGVISDRSSDNRSKLKRVMDDIFEIQPLVEKQIQFVLPNINTSAVDYEVKEVGPSGVQALCIGLGSLKGVSKDGIRSLIEVRDTQTSFETLDDFFVHAAEHLDKRAVESLAKSGALDVFGENRARVIQSVRAKTDSSPYGLMEMGEISEIDPIEILQMEENILGAQLSGSVDTIMAGKFQDLSCVRISDLHLYPSKFVNTGGRVESINWAKDKTWCRIKLADETGTYSVFAPARQLESDTIRDIKVGEYYVVRGKVVPSTNEKYPEPKINVELISHISTAKEVLDINKLKIQEKFPKMVGSSPA